MKKIYSHFLIATLSLLSLPSFAQDVHNNFKASAKIEKFCSIQTNDINFGILNLPLTSQSASGQMNVLCSNGTTYKIDVLYGSGVLTEGPNSSNIVYTVTVHGTPSVASTAYFLNKNGVSLTWRPDFQCYNDPAKVQQVYISSPEGMNEFNALQKTQVFAMGWNKDLVGICNNNGNYSQVNLSTINSLLSPAAYTHGIMKGAMKSDNLAYSISIPNDSTKVWSKGLNSYSSTGIGSLQTIDFNAKTLPDKSSSKFLAQDTYLDNVTAEIVY